MTKKEKDEIERISKSFASGFKDMIGPINGSGWLIVDPLSGYLNSCGYQNKCSELPETDKHPQVLLLEFKDGSKLIPAGEDLKAIYPMAKNWMWL